MDQIVPYVSCTHKQNISRGETEMDRGMQRACMYFEVAYKKRPTDVAIKTGQNLSIGARGVFERFLEYYKVES
jgi:hypothetical protein